MSKKLFLKKSQQNIHQWPHQRKGAQDVLPIWDPRPQVVVHTAKVVFLLSAQLLIRQVHWLPLSLIASKTDINVN